MAGAQTHLNSNSPQSLKLAAEQVLSILDRLLSLTMISIDACSVGSMKFMEGQLRMMETHLVKILPFKEIALGGLKGSLAEVRLSLGGGVLPSFKVLHGAIHACVRCIRKWGCRSQYLLRAVVGEVISELYLFTYNLDKPHVKEVRELKSLMNELEHIIAETRGSNLQNSLNHLDQAIEALSGVSGAQVTNLVQRALNFAKQLRKLI